MLDNHDENRQIVFALICCSLSSAISTIDGTIGKQKTIDSLAANLCNFKLSPINIAFLFI